MSDVTPKMDNPYNSCIGERERESFIKEYKRKYKGKLFFLLSIVLKSDFFCLLTLGVESYRWHLITFKDTHSIGLSWSRDRPITDNTKHSQETDMHVPGRDSNPQSQEASDRTPTP